MSYKDIIDIAAVIEANDERRKRALYTKDDDDEMKCSDCISYLESTFSISQFMKNHPEASFEKLTNFSSEELDELVEISEKFNGFGHRGKRCKISPKGSLFLTLMYFSTYLPLSTISGVVSIKTSTLDRIIKRVIRVSFPAFINKFIPKSIPISRIQFKNFPDAVGAVDSTTIRFYKPESHILKKVTWDAKNRVNGIKLQALVNPDGRAIHISTDFMGATHDKKLFDVSGVTDFVTVKRGVEDVILPILADRGYVGIESYNKSAIVQKRGDSKEIITRNAFIATDRQIVERYFGRFKMSWGIMSEGYRGDKENISLIIQGLVALTNYLTYLHPLTKADEPDIEKDASSEPIEVEKFTSDQNGTILLMTEKKTHSHYHLEINTFFFGIQNQGFTCHLNSVLQILFQIPFVKHIIAEARTFSPAREISEIFETMQTTTLTSHDNAKAISTRKLTHVLEPQWTQMQDCNDTYEMIISKISECVSKADVPMDIKSLFEFKITNIHDFNESWLTLNLYNNFNNAVYAINARLKNVKKFYPGPILVINLGRKIETTKYKCYQSKYEFPMNLDMSSHSSNENKQYELISIIAYANMHYVTFNRIDGKWFIFDDEYVYECPEDLIPGLYGGISKKEVETELNQLWIKTNPYKLTARLLFYKEIHFISE